MVINIYHQLADCAYAELQLAALLGKTLLEKNGELELKLRKLQDFAEETLSTPVLLTQPLDSTV